MNLRILLGLQKQNPFPLLFPVHTSGFQSHFQEGGEGRVGGEGRGRHSEETNLGVTPDLTGCLAM